MAVVEVSRKPSFGLVLPAYNEAKRIRLALDNVFSVLPREFGNDYEVIVADDGSTDATAELAASYGASVLPLPHAGKGSAVRAGMQQTQAPMRAFMDADGSFQTTDVLRLVDQLGQADIAIATRREGEPMQHASCWRALGGRALAKLCEKIAPTHISDTQCGAKAFRGSVADKLFPATFVDGFGLDRELLFLATQQSLKIAQLAIEVTPMDGSKVRPLRDGIDVVWDSWRMRRRHSH